ncbi:MAG: CTP synthase [Desulfurococcaceae archaeon]
MTKYIFVTGGVLSGLGKGITAASIGLLLKNAGYRVTAIKIDPYLNVDAGTMNPYAHGEVFVTDDGGETDLDIGHYERFLGINLSRKNNITSGQIYFSVISKERKGEYLGQCVQIIPHVTNEVKQRIREIARDYSADIVIVEIGGTVGDIEGLPFLEAARQFRFEEGVENTLYVHVALAPVLPNGELKTKPIQHSIQELRRIGIQPDMVIVRSSKVLDSDAKYKIALYGNIPIEAVFSNPDVDIVYKVPLLLHSQKLTKYILNKLNLEYREPDLSGWIELIKNYEEALKTVKIAMVGKYTKVKDSYLSITEAIKHSAAWNRVKPVFVWIEATDIEENESVLNKLEEVDGAVILPGFGKRGTEGKIKAIKFLRENNKAILGICFGMQLMVIEIARNVAGLYNANSSELDPNTSHPIIDLLPEQKNVEMYGGTLRVGARKIFIKPGTLAWKVYGKNEVLERHRHRYGFNDKYREIMERAGMVFSGLSEEGYVEVIELKDYKRFYLGLQAHPEFSSKPLEPSPVFMSFIKDVLEGI